MPTTCIRAKIIMTPSIPSDHPASPPPDLPTHPDPTIAPQCSVPSQQSAGRLLAQTSTLGFLPSVSNLSLDYSPTRRMDHRCLASVKGERGSYISSLIIVGDYLYAGASSSHSSRSTIRVWRKETLQECRGFGSGYGAVKAMVVVGGWILSAHQDMRIRVWTRNRMTSSNSGRWPKQVAEGDGELPCGLTPAMQPPAIGVRDDNSHKLLTSMPTVKDYIKTFIPSKNYVQVRRHHKRLWIEHVDNISTLAVGGTASDPLLYSASWDRTIKVWKISGFKCVESFKAHDDAINALLVSPCGFLYTASADGKVKVWERPRKVSTRQKHAFIASLEAHKSSVNALACSEDCADGQSSSHETLYSAGCDGGIVVWEREDSAQHMVATGVLRGHRHAVLCLVSTRSMLCSGSADRTIRVWRRSRKGTVTEPLLHSCVAVLQGHSSPVKCLSLAFDEAGNHFLYSSSLEHDIKLWQLFGCNGEERECDGDEGIAAADQQLQEMKAMDRKKSHRIWKFHSM